MRSSRERATSGARTAASGARATPNRDTASAMSADAAIAAVLLF